MATERAGRVLAATLAVATATFSWVALTWEAAAGAAPLQQASLAVVPATGLEPGAQITFAGTGLPPGEPGASRGVRALPGIAARPVPVHAHRRLAAPHRPRRVGAGHGHGRDRARRRGGRRGLPGGTTGTMRRVGGGRRCGHVVGGRADRLLPRRARAATATATAAVASRATAVRRAAHAGAGGRTRGSAGRGPARRRPATDPAPRCGRDRPSRAAQHVAMGVRPGGVGGRRCGRRRGTRPRRPATGQDRVAAGLTPVPPNRGETGIGCCFRCILMRCPRHPRVAAWCGGTKSWRG